MYWTEDDVEKVRDVISSGINWAVGSYVEEFERMIGAYLGTKHNLVFNSGTSALHAALLACGIGPGDEVIVPSFTFIATANAPLFVGAKPVFADIEEETLGLDPEDVKRKISSRTKAMIPVHYGGCPCRIEELRDVADDRGITLIEDAAEAYGASVGSQKVGTFGSCAILSFCQNKIITTGEGGGVVTNSRSIYDKLKLIRSHGRDDSSGDYFLTLDSGRYVALGYNFRLANILAALGVSQLKKVDLIIERRRRNASLYDSKLAKLGCRVNPLKPAADYYHVYQLYTVRVDASIRDNLQSGLARRGIMTKVYFSPIHLTEFYKRTLGHHEGELPVTERVSKEVLSLPLYVSLTEEDIGRIVTSIGEIIGGKDV
jgi:dTDP-4-amino-4,6-dideoxygalactose transaminase